jgi:hypothetical protein
MRLWVLAALIVGSGAQTFGPEGHQVDKVAVGTLFIHAMDAQSVTIARNGEVLAAFTFPKGTIMSAVDEHRNPHRLDSRRYEFHGHFELRAMTPGDVPASAHSGMAAVELLSHAPMVITAEGVDVLLEPASGQ